MWNQKHLFWGLTASALVAASLSAGLSRRQKEPAPAAPAKTGVEANEVAGYRNWTRVNPEPAIMDRQTAALCAAVSRYPKKDYGKRSDDSPHRDKYITVYVNETGRHAMMFEASPKFPEGSVIVKEKLTHRDSTVPELLTVMVKRGAGYDEANGNWEYLALDGTGTRVTARGKLESCQSCHVLHRETDFVTREYLPFDVRQRLK